MWCVLKVSYTLIKHLNKAEKNEEKKYQRPCEHVQYVCVQEVGGGYREAEWY